MMDRVREHNLQRQDEDPGIPRDDPTDANCDLGSASEYDEYPAEHPEEFIETVCTGIHDIIITGEVCLSFLLSHASC